MVSLIPLQPFFSDYFGWCLDDPAWFIHTLLAFYYMFPLWLSRAQRQTNEQLVHGIVKWYWVQLALIVGINYGIGFYTNR